MDLTPLLLKQEIAIPEFIVPRSLLDVVATGEQLFWQVEARLPDGQRVASETYVVTLE
jgi:hypothetical protein